MWTRRDSAAAPLPTLRGQGVGEVSEQCGPRGTVLQQLLKRTCRVVVVIFIVVAQLKVQLIIFCHDDSAELLPQLCYPVVDPTRNPVILPRLCHGLPLLL